MAWAFVGISSPLTVTAAALTLSEPAGVVAGDLLVACIASRTTATTSVTLPAGWTLVGEQKNNNILSTASAVPSGTMAYIVRGASAPSFAFTLPAGISVAMGQVVAYRDAMAVTPLEASTAVTTVNSITAVSVAGLTTVEANDLIVALAAGGQEAAWSSFNATSPVGASGATSTAAPTTTWLERADNLTTSGVDTSLAIFDAIKATAGATGNLTATASVSAAHVVIAGAFKIAIPVGLPRRIPDLASAVSTLGPFKASAGNIFVIGSTISSPLTRLIAYDAGDDPANDTWAVVDTETFATDIQDLAAVQDGDTVHIVVATVGTDYRYITFNLATRTFGTPEVIQTGLTTLNASSTAIYTASIVRRSTGELVVGYNGTSENISTVNYARVKGARRSTGGVWTTAIEIDSSLGAVDYSHPSLLLGSSDRVHFIYGSRTSPGAVYQRALTSANVLQTRVTVNAAAGTATPYVSGVARDVAGTTKVVINGTTQFYSFDSADVPTVTTRGNLGSARPVRLYLDPSDATKIWIYRPDSSTADLTLNYTTSEAATFTNVSTSLWVGTIATAHSALSQGATPYTIGSDSVLPIVVTDVSPTKVYWHSVLPSAPASVNVTTGAQTALATTQSAAADADLQVSAAQTTLATTQTGTIQAQEVRAVTGAQATLEATQSATAGVRLTVTTGTQTTSAVTQAAAADVDATVNGTQNTSAATQSAVADVDLAVTAAQTTLAATQAGTITAAVSLNVSAAQTTLATTQTATASAAVRNITAAQATLATTQIATAGVRLTLTGAQTLSAPTQAAAADVDLAVTGAQATLATTQAGTVGARLTVTGAQTLSAATQAATATVRLAVTTGTQTTRATTQTALALVTDSRLIIGNQTTNTTTAVISADVDVKASAAQTLTAATSTGSISIATQTKTWIKHAGVWKQATPYVRHAGVWKAATVHVKQAGNWKRA